MLITRLSVFVVIVMTACTGYSGGQSSGIADRGTVGELRGLWVTRWDYVNGNDIREIMENSSALGTTDVFWQVRGQADAYYESKLEPWGELLWRDSKPTVAESRAGPGFDPLRVAVAEAHKRGLRIHAWVNALPMWKGTVPPTDPTHPWLARPDLRLKDQYGEDQPLNDHYVIFNPVLDATHDHLVSVLGELCDHYDIDGLHLDYIRFVSETHDKSKIYPGDPASRALYTQQTGRVFDESEQGLSHYREWIKNRITRLVTRVHDEVIMTEPGRVLTAAVWRRPDLAQGYLQDAEQWLRLGLIDAAMPMIYTDKDTQYDSDTDAWIQAAGANRNRIVPGVGSYKHPSGVQTVRQITSGPSPSRYVLFAYSTYFVSRAPDQDRSDAGRRLREAHRLPVMRMANFGG